MIKESLCVFDRRLGGLHLAGVYGTSWETLSNIPEENKTPESRKYINSCNLGGGSTNYL